MYVYLRFSRGPEEAFWQVGFFAPKGEFIPENDTEYADPEDAANRVHWLNGGDGGQY